MSFEQWKSAPINTLFLLDGSPDGVLAWEDGSALLAFQRKPRITTVSIAARNVGALADLLEAAMREPPFPPPWDLRIGQPDIRAIRRLAEPLGWEAAQHYVALLRSELTRLPTPRPVVRPATSEEAESLIALDTATRAGEFRTLPTSDEVSTWLAEDQVFVTEDDEGLTGFVVTWCYPRDVRDHQFIAALAVTERARDSDVGRSLLLTALHWGRETGARKALAWVEKNDLESRRLYEALGFEAYGDEELHLLWSGRLRTPAPAERDPGRATAAPAPCPPWKRR
ncbi:MAG: GNAT family N-acetyltransferase [Ardenticatenaceae bacterium]|nr:GNAT family N-acetyltransferase [Ardenticatenaceae bacterium]